MASEKRKKADQAKKLDRIRAHIEHIPILNKLLEPVRGQVVGLQYDSYPTSVQVWDGCDSEGDYDRTVEYQKHVVRLWLEGQEQRITIENYGDHWSVYGLPFFHDLDTQNLPLNMVGRNIRQAFYPW